ncbi:MAG TPA: DUF2269 family protein [Candidatus Elarobacter sp.]|nr:DUF2269 family protein [Candidatus Elarobacter sp.]
MVGGYRVMLYLTLKLVHILLAITAVGANFTYGVWFARARRNPAFAETALRGIKFIDDYIANPAYVLMLPTGAAMVAVGGLGFGTRWISWAMGLWLVAILLAYAVYSPILKRQIAIIAQSGIDSPAYAATQGRANGAVGALGVIVLLIVVLMVFKPV